MQRFLFISFICSFSFLLAEKSETPFLTVQADAVAFCLTAQTDMSLLYNCTNGIPGTIVSGFRTFSPYYNAAAYAKIEISPDPYNSFDISYLGPLKILHRNLFNRTITANLGQVFTTPYVTDDWINLYRYEYKELMEINLFTAEYWYHMTPRYVDYFSFSLTGQARLLFLSDTYNVKSSNGPLRNLMNIGITDDMFGGWFGASLSGRPVTRWTWNLLLGGGVYGSWIDKTIYLQDRGGLKVYSNDRLHSTDVSGSLDGDFGVEYSVNSFACNVDIWISQYYGMPTAGGQLNMNNSLNVVYSDSLLTFLGVKVGFITRW